MVGIWRNKRLHSIPPAAHTLFETESHPGLHAAAEWLLRQGEKEESLQPVQRKLAKGAKKTSLKE